jgi:hypothetical protein
MSDTLKDLNEAYQRTTALGAVEDNRGVAGTNAAAQPDDPGALLPEAAVCRRYGVSDMTLTRWDRDERLSFPKPILIRGRKYRRLAELIEFEERQRTDPQVTAWEPRGCAGTGEAA